MDANKAENVYLEKLEDDWQQIPQFAEMWNRPQKRNYLSMDSGCVQVAGEFLQVLKNILKYFLTNTCTATIIYLRNL